MRRKHPEIVHVGRDGWLFLIGGTNGVLGQYRSTLTQWWRTRAWARLIAARSAQAQALGIRYVHTVVPEKLTIYDHKTDGLDFEAAKSPARRLGRRMMGHAAYVDLVGPMRAARDGPTPLYYRTDTHWNVDGCLFAYRILLRACGALPPADIGERPRFDTARARDLGEKLADPPIEVASHCVIDRDATRVYASPLVESYEAAGRAPDLHVGAHVIYRNENPDADPRVLALFGDSYAHFAPIMLTGLLAETFREVHFVWSASIDWAYVESVRPDILMFEMAERFLTRLPDDAFEVAAHGRPEHRLAPAPTRQEGGRAEGEAAA